MNTKKVIILQDNLKIIKFWFYFREKFSIEYDSEEHWDSWVKSKAIIRQ